MRLLYGHDAEVTDWVCAQIPHLAIRRPDFEFGGVLGPAVAIGVLREDGTLVAGTVFHGYDPYVKAIEVSCASISHVWARPEIVGAILRYAFERADCIRVTAATPRKATSPRRFLEGLGFRREGSIRLGFGNDNAILYSLLRDEWQAGRYGPGGVLSRGQEERPHASAGARSDRHLEGAV